MDLYRDLAEEFVKEMIERRKKGPPHEDMNIAMRGEMAVLHLLDDENREMTAGEISRQLNMTTSRIAAVLNSLQKKSLITRRTDDGDRRRVQVALTDGGRALCDSCRKQFVDDMYDMLSGLGEKDAREFVRLIRRVNSLLPAGPGARGVKAPCDQEEESGGNA